MATEARDTTDHIADGAGQPDGEVAVDEAAAHPPRHGVYGRLFQEGYHFNFFQAVRLLEKYFEDAPAPGETSDVHLERILFRPHTAMVFPAADIKAIEALKEPPDRARLVLTFLGLYGVDSPLPVYFYEELANGNPETESLRAFLDVFNHRLYAYFYRAWKKYRPDVGQSQIGHTRHTRRFLSVAGLGTHAAVQQTPQAQPLRLAAFAAWLSPHARHAEGLKKLIEPMFAGIPVRIEENVKRWVPLPKRPRMGAGGNFDLGSGAVIGARVSDISGKFRVILGPIDFDTYLNFLPGRDQARLLAFLVRLYAPDYLDYDVELHLDTSKIPPVRLGAGDVQMGLTMWLGKPSKDIITVRVTYP